MDKAFKVYNAWEAGKAKWARVFLETAQGNQKKQDPRAEKGNLLGAPYHAGGKRKAQEALINVSIARRRVTGGMSAQMAKGKVRERVHTEWW